MTTIQRQLRGKTGRAVFDDAESYENRLNRDSEWALMEGSRHFEESSAVFKALRKITKRLDDLGIPYAIVGGLALYHHGFRRFTDDVDLLVNKESLTRIHSELEGLGYLPPHAQSKHLRDTELGVRIEFLVAGQFPGDGKPKPVSFPDPAELELDQFKYINLVTLVELKLASGVSNAQRMKDISDVFELIKILNISESFAASLNPFVRDKFLELRRLVSSRYVLLWRNKWLTAEAKNIGEMIESLSSAAAELKAMQDEGVVLEDNGGTGDDYALLVTTDPDVAKKYGMVEESEYWGSENETDDDKAGHQIN